MLRHWRFRILSAVIGCFLPKCTVGVTSLFYRITLVPSKKIKKIQTQLLVHLLFWLFEFHADLKKYKFSNIVYGKRKFYVLFFNFYVWEYSYIYIYKVHVGVCGYMPVCICICEQSFNALLDVIMMLMMILFCFHLCVFFLFLKMCWVFVDSLIQTLRAYVIKNKKRIVLSLLEPGVP